MRKKEALTRAELVDALARLAQVGAGELFIRRHTEERHVLERTGTRCSATRLRSPRPVTKCCSCAGAPFSTDRRQTHIDMACVEEDDSVIVTDGVQKAWHFQSGDPRFQRTG